MALVAITNDATGRVPAGARLEVEIRGEIPSYLLASIYQERLKLQLQMAGFDVDALTVVAGAGVVSKTYSAKLSGRYNATTSVSGTVGMVVSAAERAGSWSPTATVVNYGQPKQPDLPQDSIAALASSILKGVGDAVEGAGAGVKAVPRTVTLIIVGLVVVVGLVAFGPNVSKIASKV